MPIIIDSFTIDPPRIAPGESATVTVVAHDSRDHTATVEGTVTNRQGDTLSFSGAITVEMPLTYRALPPSRGKLEPHPVKPGVFIYTAESVS